MAIDYVLETDGAGHPLTWADPLNITWSFYSAGQPTDSIFSSALPSNSVFTQDIINAFASWSNVANVHFVQVADSSASDIRLGWESIDGPGRILAETYYDYGSGAHFTGADIGFDVRDPWTLTGGDEKSQGAPFYITALHEIGHAIGLDHYNAQSAVMNAYIDPSLTGLTIHDIDGIVALYGQADSSPLINATSKSITHNTTVSATSLFTASDPDGDAIVTYRFADLSGNASSGYWIVNGVIQASNTPFEVAAADLASVQFVVGTSGADTLQISASDGTHYGTPANITITATDYAPVVTAANIVATHGQVFTAAQLFGTSDADGDSMVSYQVVDRTTTATTGHWDIAGVDQLAGSTITVAASNLADLTFESGSGNDTLNVRAFDGSMWGAWVSFSVRAPIDHAPVVTGTNVSATHGQVFTAAQLFGASDADGDPIVSYQVIDKTTGAASGHWDIAGADQVAGNTITLAPSDLSNLTFESRSGSDTLNIRAFDGTMWGAWDRFSVTAPVDHAPVVVHSGVSVAIGSHIAAASLFTVSDAENDAITKYQFQDSSTGSSSGYWEVNGAPLTAGQPFQFDASDLPSVDFVGGSTVGVDHLIVRAYDDMMWGSWHKFDIQTHA